jgi:hypothetical protein
MGSNPSRNVEIILIAEDEGISDVRLFICGVLVVLYSVREIFRKSIVILSVRESGTVCKLCSKQFTFSFSFVIAVTNRFPTKLRINVDRLH